MTRKNGGNPASVVFAAIERNTMPQPCKICVHASRQAIDDALLANRDGLRIIGAQYGVSKDSLSRHFRTHLEPRQATGLEQLTEPQQVSEPQTATSKPSAAVDRYRAFVQRFSGGRAFSMTEVRGWGYSPEELQVFIEVAVESGDLSRRTEP